MDPHNRNPIDVDPDILDILRTADEARRLRLVAARLLPGRLRRAQGWEGVLAAAEWQPLPGTERGPKRRRVVYVLRVDRPRIVAAFAAHEIDTVLDALTDAADRWDDDDERARSEDAA